MKVGGSWSCLTSTLGVAMLLRLDGGLQVLLAPGHHLLLPHTYSFPEPQEDLATPAPSTHLSASETHPAASHHGHILQHTASCPVT